MYFICCNIPQVTTFSVQYYCGFSLIYKLSYTQYLGLGVSEPVYFVIIAACVVGLSVTLIVPFDESSFI